RSLSPNYDRPDRGCHGAIAKLIPAALIVDSSWAAAPSAPATYTGTARREGRPRDHVRIAATALRTGPPIPSGISQNRPFAMCDAWLYLWYAATPMRCRAGNCSTD